MNRLISLLILFHFTAGSLLGQSSPTPPAPSSTHPSDAQKIEKAKEHNEEVPCPLDRNKTAEAKFADYVIRTYRWPQPEGCLRISKRGKLVYSLSSADFKIGGNFYHEKGIPIGTDITGEGVPNAVVGEWSGGAHCCFTLHVFELGDTFREIAAIKADDSDGANFVDLDHDGRYEFEGNDWAFAYWSASFMASPAPRIVLKYRGGRFRLAADLMSKPVPSPEEFARTVRQVKTDGDWGGRGPDWLCDQECGIPVSLWKSMLDYMYTGHADLAWSLLNESWPAKREGEKAFADGFCQQLKHSHYWRDLHPWIGPCPGHIRP